MTRRIWEVLHRYRVVTVAAVQLLLCALALYLAFALRLDTFTPWREHYGRFFLAALPVLLIIRLGTFVAFGLLRGMWRYVSMSDLLRLFGAVTLGTALFIPLGAFWLAQGEFYSKSVFILDWAFCMLLLGGVRFVIRAFRERFVPMKVGGRRVLIAGAGDAGEMVLREMRTHQHLGYLAVGFVDDDAAKHGTTIHGVKVIGGISDLVEIVEANHVDEVIVSIPSATGGQMQRILDVCREARVRLRRLPTEGDIVRLTQIRDVEVEDLLERPTFHLDEEGIRRELEGKRILVTGAGGSIGSEIVRQLAAYRPGLLCLVDWSENALFFLERELLDGFPEVGFRIHVADIRDASRMDAIFAEEGFFHVYHAAAFKHVPLMETNPLEAVKNNVGGTRVLARCARRHGVRKFVLISSDKAVRPTSIMGATKRAAELFLCAQPEEETQFLSVRFGNVLGSQGSVIPLFKRQIAAGGPVTVTDPEVVRYFMTIREAVELVLQAGTMGRGGEVLVLDMGEQVKIVDLARKLIALSGFEPEVDIPIRFVGLRPGEKLFEELLVKEDGVDRTEHDRIWVARADSTPAEDVEGAVDRLIEAAVNADVPGAVRCLAALVPDFAPSFEEHRRIVEAARRGLAG